MKKYIILCILTPHHLCGWSFSEAVHNATDTVASWLGTQQTHTSSKEYQIAATSPITVTNSSGTIKVTTWNKPAIMVAATKRGSEEAIKKTTFTVSVKNDAEQSVIITTEPRSKTALAAVDYELIVPRTAPLTIRNEAGAIHVHDHRADLDAQTLNGSIVLEQTTKNVKAKAPNGTITVEQQEIKDDASIFVEAGFDVTLVMPENANTSISAHTPQGKISSEIFITLYPMTTRLNKDAFKRMQQNVRGTTGAGGVPITLESIKGNITIIGN